MPEHRAETCPHPPGHASGHLQILAFIICDDCNQLIRFLPNTGIDYTPLAALIAATKLTRPAPPKRGEPRWLK